MEKSGGQGQGEKKKEKGGTSCTGEGVACPSAEGGDGIAFAMGVGPRVGQGWRGVISQA